MQPAPVCPNETRQAQPPSSRLRGTASVFGFAALILAGALGNHFAFPIFFNAEFIFGSIFSMLALQFFGAGWGTFGAACISSVLFFNWGHHYALAIMGAEVAIVGWLHQRRGVGFIQADALYWLCLGMPLVYLFYHVAMNVPADHARFIMVKDMVNGLANMVVARLIFTCLIPRLGRPPLPYREAVYNALAFFVLAPTLTLLAISGRSQFQETDRNIRTTLHNDNRRLTERIQVWVLNRKSAALYLARLAALTPPQKMQPFLEQAQQADLNFLRIGLLDRNANSIAFYPLRDELGRSNLGRNFSDRPFIPRLQRDLKPMLSEVVMAKIGPPKPMVAMLAPVVASGIYNGYVAGILSLEQIRSHLDTSVAGTDALYTLLDRDGRIIMTNRPDQKTMMPLARGRGHLEPLEAGIDTWLPAPVPNSPATERWGRSFYVAESHIGELAEWKLILEQPVAPFQKALFDRYSKNLALLLGLLVLSLAVAELVSRGMTRSLEELGELTRELPAKLAGENPAIHWPASSIQEPNQLVSNFRSMALSLSEHFALVRQVNESLEKRVQERTQELRESEEKFRTVVDYTYDWELWDDPNGDVLYCSPSSMRVTGYPPEAFQADANLIDRLIHPDDLPRWRAHYAKVHSDPSASPPGQSGPETLGVRIIRADGETRWIEHVCHPIQDQSGQFKGRRISNRDDTERKRLEAQLHESQKMESLGILAGGVAHEMNNVLGAILGLASLHLELQPEGSPLRRAFRTITDACIRGRDVVRGLLGFARQSLAEEKPLDMNLVVQEEVLLLEHTTLAQLRIQTELAPDLRKTKGDVGALTQALMNICLNALDAMSANGTLTIRTRNVDRDWIEVLVEDTGCGMAKEVLERAMDPFFTTKDPNKGTGLGLSIAHTTLTAHHGHLHIESAPGRGTSVSLRLPACEPGPEAPVAVPDPPRIAPATSLSILVVDDDELIQNSLQGLLEAMGHTVLCALSGEDALSKLEGGYAPNVVILDMNMPGLSGAEVLPRLRALHPEIPVLLATGRPDQAALDLASAHPLVALLPKPFGAKELQAHLQAWTPA